MTRFTLTFLAVFLLGSACGLIVVWADAASWGSVRAGDIMAATFLISMMAALIGASMTVKS